MSDLRCARCQKRLDVRGSSDSSPALAMTRLCEKCAVGGSSDKRPPRDSKNVNGTGPYRLYSGQWGELAWIVAMLTIEREVEAIEERKQQRTAQQLATTMTLAASIDKQLSTHPTVTVLIGMRSVGATQHHQALTGSRSTWQGRASSMVLSIAPSSSWSSSVSSSHYPTRLMIEPPLSPVSS